MYAVNWVDADCPCLSEKDTVRTALKQLQSTAYRWTELPLRLSTGKFFGFFVPRWLDKDISPTAPATQYCSGKEVAVRPDVPHYEVWRMSQLHQGLSVAVVEADDLYVGTITSSSMIRGMAAFSAVRETGAILSLRMRQEDYTLHLMSHLVESNGAKIIDSTVIQEDDPSHIFLVIKLNCADSTAVYEALTYHGYTVLQHNFPSSVPLPSKMHKNYASLMKYLSI